MPPKAVEAPKMLTISYKEFMESQNEVVSVINNHCAVAQGMITTFSMSMNSMRSALLRTRASIKDVMGASGVDVGEHGLSQHYPAIAELLNKDPSEIGSGGVQFTGIPLAIGGLPEKRKRKKREAKPKDPNAPKRPQTAFFLYLDLTRDAVGKDLGPSAKPGEIADEQRLRWRAMSDEEKEVYKRLYQANFEEYKTTMAHFISTKSENEGGVPLAIAGAGAEADVDDDEDDDDDDDDDSDEDDDDDDDEEEEEEAPAPPAKKGRKTAAAAKKDDLLSKIDPSLRGPPPPVAPKSPEKKGKKNAPAAAAATEAEKPKSAKKAKAASPEEPKKKKGAAGAAAAAPPAAAGAEVVDTSASAKKKRKSTGAEVDEKKKKRKETHGDDY